jgi:iron(III) transport system ATP-binding protein
LTLAENVAFGLEMRKISSSETQQRVLEALERVHLAERAHDKPNQLSGGQQQRVALARALVIRPQCILLDEPLSNLDAKLRLEMRSEIRSICKQAGLTALYVTHDQKEALSIADRIAVMKDGVIQQVGGPEELYQRPSNRFVAGFIGEANFIQGRIREVTSTAVTVEAPCGIFVASIANSTFALNEEVELCMRPENIRFDQPSSNLPNRLHGHFCESTYLGEVAQHLISIPSANESPILLKAFELGPKTGRLRLNETVDLWIEQHHVIITKQTPSAG